VRITATTERPGRSRSNPAWFASRTIFTGTRCVTFVKLPVALSGGSKRELRSAGRSDLRYLPFQDQAGKLVDADLGGVAFPNAPQLRFAVVGLHPYLPLDQRDDLSARTDQLSGAHLRSPTIPSSGATIRV
jgi:hypothetical protein